MKPESPIDTPRPSSSQPTGCRGRRVASTAPTVGALTSATRKGTALAFNWTRSTRPARRSRWSNQRMAAIPIRASAHSAHASPAGDRSRATRAAWVSAMILGACSVPSPASQISVACQCGRPASRERYGTQDDIAAGALPGSRPSHRA